MPGNQSSGFRLHPEWHPGLREKTGSQAEKTESRSGCGRKLGDGPEEPGGGLRAGKTCTGSGRPGKEAPWVGKSGNRETREPCKCVLTGKKRDSWVASPKMENPVTGIRSGRIMSQGSGYPQDLGMNGGNKE
ncbi:hypothetical protein L6452_19349 [Arctium lappa]|uniref:Uncharacterized protein n=1 Tax=Arctium lappa TaxID=4217 RepID=A0ACB9B8F1_ARCLA|nr:hypothetical protein L6452_19349 [Arctium lappa]